MIQSSFDKSQSARLAEFNGGLEAIVEGTVRRLGRGFVGKVYVIGKSYCSFYPFHLETVQ